MVIFVYFFSLLFWQKIVWSSSFLSAIILGTAFSLSCFHFHCLTLLRLGKKDCVKEIVEGGKTTIFICGGRNKDSGNKFEVAVSCTV